jgi:hypothetical protein
VVLAMTAPSLPGLGLELKSGATFSPCRRWRYSLVRQLEIAPIRRCLFVMLNPSTADEVALDPTVRRCAGFAKAWGYPWLDVANLFAWRSTEPRALLSVDDPVGDENDAAIHALAREASLIVCAWGSHAFLKGRLTERAVAVTKMLRRHYLYAEALLSWPSSGWGPSIFDCVWIELYETPKAWWVKSHVDIRGLEAGQWNRSRPFPTLDEAAREAADLWAEGVRLALAYWRGEPLRHPGEMVAEAWEATSEQASASKVIAAMRKIEDEVFETMDVPGWHARCRAASEDRRAAEDAMRKSREEWIRARDWRDHRDTPPAYMAPEQPRGQLSLLEVA